VVRFALASFFAALAVTIAGAGNPPPAAVAPPLPEGWYADVETSLGTFTIRLFVDQAPQTVADFAAFARGTMEFVDAFTGERVKRPFYDGLKIHSVHYMERFEAGDPTGTSRGAPPVWVPKENGPFGFSHPYRVGMTAAALKRISGVLFFVSAVSAPYLDTSHNCFGEVVVGKDTVDRIVRVRTDENKVPIDPVTIEHIRIRSVGNPPPIPEPRPYRPPIPVFRPRDPSLIH
jgi:peptidyl-prolyl cis-trans isomerase A (cyclophilin A)